jgi:plasmid maintenance system antidote protein VapI
MALATKHLPKRAIYYGKKGGVVIENIMRDVKPSHPGTILKDLLLPRLGLTVKYLSYRSGMSEAEVTKLLAGKITLDRTRKNKLRPIFGAAADVLFRQQKIFDFYVQHGERPVSRGPLRKRYRNGATPT